MKKTIKIDTINSKSIPSYVDVESISNLEINNDPFILVGKNNSGKSTLLNILSNSKTQFLMEDEKITPIVIKIDSENLDLSNENKKTSKIKELMNFENELEPETIYLSQLNEKLSKKFNIKFEKEISPVLKAEFEKVDISKCGNGINKLLYINWIVDKVDLIYNFEANESIKKYGIEKLLIEIFSKFFDDGSFYFNEIHNYLKRINRNKMHDPMHIFTKEDYSDLFVNRKNEIGAKKSLDNNFENEKINEFKNSNSIMSSNIFRFLNEHIDKNANDNKTKELFKRNMFTISHLFDILMNEKIIRNSDFENIMKNLEEIEINISPPSKCILFLIDEPENSLQESFRKEIVNLVNKLSGELKIYDFRFVISTHSENMLWLMKDKLENYHVAFKAQNSTIKYVNIFNNDFDSFCSKINSIYEKLRFSKGENIYNVTKEYISYLITQIDTLRIFFSDNITFVEGYDEKLIFESMDKIVIPTDGFYNFIILFELIDNFHEHFEEVESIIDYDISNQKKTMDENNKKLINYLNDKERFVNSKFKILQSKYPDIISFAREINKVFEEAKHIDPFTLKTHHLEFKNKRIEDIVFSDRSENLKILTFENLIKRRKPKLETIFDTNEIIKLSDKLFLIKNYEMLNFDHKVFLEENDGEYKIYIEVSIDNKSKKFTIFENGDLNDLSIIYNSYLSYEPFIFNEVANLTTSAKTLFSSLTFVLEKEINDEDFNRKLDSAIYPFLEEQEFLFDPYNLNDDIFEFEEINDELIKIKNYLVIDFDKNLNFKKMMENSKFPLRKIISDFIYGQNNS